MNRNVLYLVIGVLAVAALALGYQVYQQQRTTGIQIDVGKGSVSIETKWHGSSLTAPAGVA